MVVSAKSKMFSYFLIAHSSEAVQNISLVGTVLYRCNRQPTTVHSYIKVFPVVSDVATLFSGINFYIIFMYTLKTIFRPTGATSESLTGNSFTFG